MQTATYKGYGVVSVLAIEGALAQISANGNEFWVKAAALKPDAAERKRQRIAKATECPLPAPIVDWFEQHLDFMTAEMPADASLRFEETYQSVTGELTVPQAGVIETPGTWGISLNVYLTADIPEEFKSEIQAVQMRFGKNAEELFAKSVRVVYCNELGWELVRRGHRFGKSQ